MDDSIVLKLNELLLGMRVVRVSCDSGCLQIDFGHAYLSISCSWRVQKGPLIWGSGSQDFNGFEEDLVGERVEALEVLGELHDMRLSISGAVLETFADADQYESWTLSVESYGMFISGPGKLWSSF